MRKAIIPPLSIRQKILGILVCYIVGILGMLVVSQEDVITAKDNLELVELAYSLNSEILEIRRYEKNFLLYGTKEALQENQSWVQRGIMTVESIEKKGTSLKARPKLIAIKNLLLDYRQSIEQLAAGFQQDGQVAGNGNLEEMLRHDGQKMAELSKELVSFQHLQILSILNALVEQLLVWTLVALLVGIFLPIMLSIKIFRPLGIIKNATEDIAQARFQRIEVVNTRDEMQQVMEAFNTMVNELEKRQEQLVQSQKLSSIGTLTAGIAHQLNNPLNNISTSCQIAMQEFQSNETAMMERMLTNIQQETYRARDVVQGLLEFSRTREFACRPVNLRRTVKRAVQLVRSQVPAPISIEVEIPKALVVPMDDQRVQEVLLNLLLNASQAIEGQGQITISARVDDGAGEAVITVADTGTGISEKIRDRLFDPFYTTKEEGQGTGLGLSIAYGIIQRHHGRITVDSTPGHGAAFHIHLPLMVDAADYKAGAETREH